MSKFVFLFLLAVIFGISSAGNGLHAATNLQENDIIEILKNSRRVLWIAAHPDDENSAAALLARAKDLSGALYMVSLTSGQNSDVVWGGLRRGSEIGAAREKLFRQSGEDVLHADGVDIGPFVNGKISLADLDAMAASAPHQPWPHETTSSEVITSWNLQGNPLTYIANKLREIKPDVIIAMDGHCGVSGHPEHIAVAKLLLQALPLAAKDAPHIIFTADVMPQLQSCNYCKCEGVTPQEPIQSILSMDKLFNTDDGVTTYFGKACKVARVYENAMKEKNWSREDLTRDCASLETRALRAYERGVKSPQFSQRFRLWPRNIP